MTTFDKREQAFEAKYAHDQETVFKTCARRNKLLGLWAAGQLGLTGGGGEAYAKLVVTSDYETPDHQDVFEKVWGDIRNKHLDITQAQVRQKMQTLLEEAQEQIVPNWHQFGVFPPDGLSREPEHRAVWPAQVVKTSREP
jgi:hypothetical protein